MKSLLVLALFAGCYVFAQGSPICDPPGVTALPESQTLDEAQRAALLTEVISLIEREHYDPTFGGVDLGDLRQRYEPQVLAAGNDGDVYRLLMALAEEVNAHYEPPMSEPAAGGSYGGVGMFVHRAPDGQALEVHDVYPGAPAEAAGLARGDLILTVDGRGDCPTTADILGEAGTTVVLTVRSPGGEPRDVSVTRGRIRPGPIVAGYRLSEQPEIAYVRVADYMVDGVERALSDVLSDLDIRQEGELPEGLILDFRGVWLCRDDQLMRAIRPLFSGPLYYYVGAPGAPAEEVREAPGSIRTPRNTLVQQLPLAVLVDGNTANCFEALAGMLQAEGRAVLVGTSTAGNTLRGRDHDLPGGGFLWVPGAEQVLPDGTSILGTGVAPDVAVDVQAVAPFVPGGPDDPFIRAAVQALESGSLR